MRRYIEEVTDYRWDEIKNYILKIKNFSPDGLISEAINNKQCLDPDASYLKMDEWISDYRESHKEHTIESLIATAIEEKFYILQDEEEHEWNQHVIHSVLNGEGWIHRWDNREYK